MSDKGVVQATVATSSHANPHNKRPTFIYPTVSPETVVIPIVSCIFGFPLLALLVICCLRKELKWQESKHVDATLNTGMIPKSTHMHINERVVPKHNIICSSFENYIKTLGRSSRAVSLRSERAMSRGFPSLELDTVLEERSDPEPEATVIEMVTPDRDSDS